MKNFRPLPFDTLRSNMLEQVPLQPPSALTCFKTPFPNASRIVKLWQWRLKSRWFDYYYSVTKLWRARSGDLVIVSRKSALGDVVVATSVIPALRQSRPNARIVFHTSETAAPMLLFDPDLDFILVKRIERDAYTYIHLSYEYQRDGPNIFDAMVHSAGVDGTGHRPRLVLTQAERQWAEDWKTSFKTNEGGLLVGIHAGYAMPNKAWPQKRWFELVKWLQENGYAVVEFGAVPGYDSCLGLSAHGLPLRVVLAMVSACDAVICVDSFIMHVAVALDIPCIPLLGGTRADRYLPASARAWPVSANSPCRHCHHWGESPRSYTPCIQDTVLCMNSIEVSDVVETLRRYFEEQAGTRSARQESLPAV